MTQPLSLRHHLRNTWNQIWARIYCLRGDAHRHFGNSYADLREYWAAIEDYTRATLCDPGYAQPYYNRGVLYWREIGNYYRSVQDLARVIELNPAWAEAYLNRGLAHKLHRQPDRAIADLEEYLVRGQDSFWLESARRQLAELRDESVKGPPQPQELPRSGD
jgi:tetratricopeptide (TPR) repeat protein